MSFSPSNFERIVVPALDGYKLSATVFLPPTRIVFEPILDPSGSGQVITPPTKVVLMSAATATIQDFYYKFARFLSQELGFVVLTYDNRGVGRSLPSSGSQVSQLESWSMEEIASGKVSKERAIKEAKLPNPLIGFKATIVDWALQDLPGMFSYILERFPKNPTIFVGHSVGGHILPAVEPQYLKNLERVMFVAATSAHYRDMNNQFRTWFIFNCISPIVNPRYGFYPGKTLYKVMEDLPIGCHDTWSHWSMFKNYTLGGNPEWKEKFDNFKFPIYSICFSDDEFSTNSAHLIVALTPNAQSRVVKLYPNQDLKMKRVGHMGFFFNVCKEKLWKTAAKSWMVDGRAMDQAAIAEAADLAGSYARL